MIYRSILLLTGLLLFSFLNLKGQQECKQLLVKYLEEISVPDIPENDKVYFLHALYEYDFYEKYNISDFNSEVKVIVSKNQAIYETPQISYYNDTTDLFVAYHSMNRIIWSDGVQNPNASMQKMDILEIQKKLIESGTITYCKKTRVNKRKYKKIELSFKSEVQQEVHIYKMSFLYDLKSESLKEMWVYFTNDQKLRTQKITINTINFDYKDWYPTPVKDLIFDEKGNLNSRYSYYHLISNKN